MTQRRTTPRQKAQDYNTVKEIGPRNRSQEKYLEAIDNNIVTFGVGPAGTGKTYLAMYQAICHHWNKKNTNIKRIVLTRPVVEAGEKLGFLPGMLEDKMDPYMRPLYDALYDIVGLSTGQEKISKKIIEIAPVAYMRGRTFHDSFVILDEAQNCTYEQLKMVLTRLVSNVYLIISVYTSQSDLNGKSGLSRIVEALENTEDVGVVRFKTSDVERSKIVKNVLYSLEQHEEAVRR